MIDIPVSALETLAVDTASPVMDVAGLLDVAQSVERSGYQRIWYAEHHSSAHLVAFPPAVVAARVAAEILRLVGEHSAPAEPWLLASSPNGAGVAARLGLPMAFAHHLRPQNTAESAERYRREFRPSPWSDSPRLMLSVTAFCAEDEAQAASMARPMEILLSRVLGDQPNSPILDRATAAAYEFTPVEAMREHVAQGTPDAVRAHLEELAGRFGADELILWTPVVDAKDRARSFELIMQA